MERKAGRVTKSAITEHPEVEETPQEAPEGPKGRFKTTMEDMGPRLPVGILSGSTLHKDIVVKRWTTKEERELGGLIPSKANLAEHVSIVVGNMCSKLGPYDLDSMKPEQKSVAISTMYMADVFYAYAWLRRRAMGNKLRVEITCPRCEEKFPYVGLLDTIDVMAVEEIDSILWTYKLEEPIEIRRKTATHFQMAYPKWTTIEQAKGSTNEAYVKALTILGTIVGLNDDQEPVALTMQEIDEMSKLDFEQIQEGVNTHFLGPKMAIEGKCMRPACARNGGTSFVFPINWRYQDFFGATSR